MNGGRAVAQVPSLDRDEAVDLAEAEYARLLALADTASTSAGPTGALSRRAAAP